MRHDLFDQADGLAGFRFSSLDILTDRLSLTSLHDGYRAANQTSPKVASPLTTPRKERMTFHTAVEDRSLSEPLPRPRAHVSWDVTAHWTGRAPINHGSFLPYSSPSTSKINTPNRYSTSQRSSRGSPPKFTSSVSGSSTHRQRHRSNVHDDMPYVNLDTFDENFATPQRLTPLSRRTMEKFGFEAETSHSVDLSSIPRSPLRSPRTVKHPPGSPRGAVRLRVASTGETIYEHEDGADVPSFENQVLHSDS